VGEQQLSPAQADVGLDGLEAAGERIGERARMVVEANILPFG